MFNFSIKISTILLLVAIILFADNKNIQSSYCLAPAAQGYDELIFELPTNSDDPNKRPAMLIVNTAFLTKLENTNPGIFEKVKKVIETYCNALKAGEDYDDIIGRSLIIDLQTPIDGFSRLILKGAVFSKENIEQTFKLESMYKGEAAKAVKEGATLEFNKQGNTIAESPQNEVMNALNNERAKNEFSIGQTSFYDPAAPVNILPIMRAKFLKNKGPSWDLGVVVIATPYQKEIRLGAVLKQKVISMKEIEQEINTVKQRITVITQLYSSIKKQEKLQEFMQKLIKEQEELKQLMQNHRNKQKELQKLIQKYGKALRVFHDSGYTHGNPHANNALYDLATKKIYFCDLSDSRLKSSMTKEQGFAYQLRDVYYVLLSFNMLTETWGANSILFCIENFLMAYLDKDQIQQLTKAQIPIDKLVEKVNQTINASIKGKKGKKPINLFQHGNDPITKAVKDLYVRSLQNSA